jgi:hypothetical protein
MSVVRGLCAADSFATKMHVWAILGSLVKPSQPTVQGVQDGLKPATFGAAIRRYLFLRVSVCCRIGLDKPVSLLQFAHRCSVLLLEWCQVISERRPAQALIVPQRN